MKNQLLVFAFWLFISGCAIKQNAGKAPARWTNEMADQYLKNRDDSTTWDTEMFNNDRLNSADFDLPFTVGVFPTPKYDLLVDKSFNGVGNFGLSGGEGNELKIEDKTILFNSFYAGKNAFNQAYLDDNKPNEIFFHIVVLTDLIDTLDYTHLMSGVVSRNHPDYIGQGFYKTKESRIDYAAFITADRNAYAIVNMRLFDLTKGKTILIAPQKDKSFRSMQIDSPSLSREEIEGFTKTLLETEDVRRFFTAAGNI